MHERDDDPAPEEAHPPGDGPRPGDVALAAIRNAAAPKPELPQPPAGFDDGQLAALSRAWRLLPAEVENEIDLGTGWRRRLRDIAWRLLRPILQRQQQFNTLLLRHFDANVRAASESRESAAAVVATLDRHLGLLATFQSHVIEFLRHLDRAAEDLRRSIDQSTEGLRQSIDALQQATRYTTDGLRESVDAQERAAEDLRQSVDLATAAAHGLKREVERLRRRSGLPAGPAAADLPGRLSAAGRPGRPSAADAAAGRVSADAADDASAAADVADAAGRASTDTAAVGRVLADAADASAADASAADASAADASAAAGAAAGRVSADAVDAIDAASRPGAPAETDLDAYQYVCFEDVFRGEPEEIAARQRDYLPYFEGASDVLDIGCGRGEFLALLRGEGIAARGVDLNADAVERCRERGVEAARADALAYLRALADGSIGGLFSAQVVEHLEADYLMQMLGNAHRALRPGSRIVLETINPASWTAFFSAYVRDITHRHPLHPETLAYLLRASGFVDVSIVYRAPVPDAAKLQRAAVDPELAATPAGRAVCELADTLNQHADRLNGLMFAEQDYAAVARRP